MMQRQPTTQKTSVALLVYLLSVSVLEVLAYRLEGMFSVIAAWLWMLTGIVCFVAFLTSVILTFCRDIRGKRYFLLIGYFILLALFCSVIGNLSVSDISYEAALQTAAGLSSFSEPDLNYTGVAFLNYANRQYVLNAIPSLLFGRNVFTLHLGFALPFLIGMTLLYLEIRKWLSEKGVREEYALLPMYALPSFPYITEYYMNFEQTLTPVTLTMAGLALLMHFYRKRDVFGVISLSFVGGMCCNAYTPVLAFFGFLLVFLALWEFKNLWHYKKTSAFPNRNEVWELLVCFGVFTQLLTYFTATLMTPQKAMITTVKQNVSLLEAVFTAWYDFFSDTEATFWGLWLTAVLFYLFFALLGQLKLHDFLIAGWMLLTVFFSSYMTGYTSYAKCHEIQRNMLIIPVFITALFFALVHFFKKVSLRAKKFLLPAALLFFLLLGGLHFLRPHQSFLYYGYIQPMKYLFACTEEVLQEHDLSDTDEFNLILLTDNSLQTNLSDYTAYFYPNAHTYVSRTTEVPADIDFSLPTFFFSESEEFPLEGIISASKRTYKNIRYRNTTIWYYTEK